MPAETKAAPFASINPATGEVLREFDCTAAEDVRAAVERARAAQPAWHQLGVSRRLQILRRFQSLLQEKKAEVAAVITREAGKPYVEALLTEVLVVLDAAQFCIASAPALLRDQRIGHANLVMKAKRGCVRHQPYGVVGIISPWNYPFATPGTEGLAALAVGNAVVIKPSEFTTLCALELQSLLRLAGAPDGIFQVVPGGGATGAALVNSSVDKLIFTGSVASGKKVAQAAAARLLPVVLELGGKDPMLVLDDADLEVASSAAVWGAFVNAGQACLSVERCYVYHSLYERFLAAVVEKTGKLRVGNGLDPHTDVGPMIHQRQLQIVEEHVEDARGKGGRVLAGGTRLPQLGPNFYAPTVVADAHHGMRLMREETFGPVLPVMPVESDEHAIALANDSEFGLAASVWTRDRARGAAIAGRLQAGTVMVNDVISCYGISEAPHGGVKSSGLGRTHGLPGLEEMVWVKYVDSDLLPRLRKVWWYGYGPEFTRQMEGFVEFLFSRNWGSRLAGGVRALKAYFRRGWL
ncbi:MAG TPA: aldehyde dehydrogenase family protein [Terriglobales bacterium]|nr:aldehyde dehydrogenase family protein [Terriglobales bacterium]